MTPDTDLIRIEVKVDLLTHAINRLVLFEERQAVQAIALTTLKAQTTAVEQKLDMWVNRGMGVWAFAVTALGIFQIASKYL